jgi:hypothetical protein
VVDLEDPQPVQQIVTPVGEGIQAGAQDHILAHPIGGRLLDDVLGEPGPHAHPAAEGDEERVRQLRPQPLPQRRPLAAGQAEGEIVVNDPWPGFLTVKGPGNRRQHGGATRAPSGVRHAK